MNIEMLNDDDRRAVSYAAEGASSETNTLLDIISRLTDRLGMATQVAAAYVEVYIGTTEHSKDIYQKALRVCAGFAEIDNPDAL